MKALTLPFRLVCLTEPFLSYHRVDGTLATQWELPIPTTYSSLKILEKLEAAIFLYQNLEG